MKQFFKYIVFSLCYLLFNPLMAQERLYAEDFNYCMVPADWETNISYGEGTGFYVGQPTNPNSDSTSIDGSCMMVFDDDILGNNMPTFVAEVATPFFETKGYNTVRLHTDISFREYGTSTLSVYVEEAGGQRFLVAQYGEGQQTGSQFSDFAALSLDLSFFTQSEQLRIVYIYDDKDMYAWYAGIDNVEVIGSGEGEIILIEQFNSCGLPQGWSTNVLEGEQDWTFGLFDNENANATSMNGTCFAFFDDDKIGREAPFSTADLRTPWFDGTQFATFSLEMELIFRRYGDFENVSVWVNDGEKMTIVHEFVDAVGGPQITNNVPVQLDLTAYRSSMMQVVFRYDDGNEWGWWTGIDNVKIMGSGSINDLCLNYEPLEIGKACLPSENKNAVFSGPPNSCYSNGEGSLWYALTAPENGIIRITNESSYNDLISIFQGTCDNLLEMSCSNRDEHGFRGEEVFFNANKNEQYFVRISGIRSGFGLPRGRNCISASYVNELPQPVAEDVVESAVSLSIDGEPKLINNTFSNIENQVPEDNLLARSDIWYTFTTTDQKDMMVQVTADFAENTIVYDEAFAVVHAQLEGGDFALRNLLPNTTYYLQIGGTFAIIEGQAEIALSTLDVPTPEADDCFTYDPLPFDQQITYDNLGQSFSGVHSTCDIYADLDRWYSFIAENSTYFLNIESEFIANATFFRGNCENLEEIFCHTGIQNCQGSIVLNGLDENERYFLQLSESKTNNNNITGSITFSLTREEVSVPEISLSVTTECLEDGLSELQIMVDSEVPYTLAGNEHGELLFEGDSYLVVAIPEEGCEKSVRGTIDCQGTGCKLDLEHLVTYPSCAGAIDGSLQIEVEQGLGPFTYDWGHRDEDVSGFASIASGLYQVTVTDALGCVRAEEILISEPQALESHITYTDQITADANDGTATVEITGGTLPYTVTWSNGAEGMNIENLAPGEYAVTISDFGGCTSEHTFIISEVDCIFAIEAAVEHVSCFGESDAQIDLTATSGIVSVVWDNDATGLTLSNLPEGVFTANIIFENGCEKIVEYSIVQPQEIIIESDISHIECFGESNGMISPLVAGGNGGYTYLWEDGTTNPERDYLSQGDYTLIVTDQKGCVQESTFTVDEPEALEVASAMVSDLSCADSQDGQICVFVEGGTPPYQFDWKNIEDGMSKMTDLAAGTYNLQITDANQCTLNIAQNINAPLPLEVEIENISIMGDNDGEIGISISGGVAPYEVTWFQNDDVVGTGTTINGLKEGIYRAVITDANGCVLNTSEILLSPTSSYVLPESEFLLYPNPARDQFSIDGAVLRSIDQLKITTVNGADVTSMVEFVSDGSQILAKTERLQSGLYFLKIERIGKSGVASQAFIISEF